MHCPHPDHEDTKRSASLNVKEGVWWCFGCEQGGPVDRLARQISSGEWGSAAVRAAAEKTSEPSARLDPEDVGRWHKFLRSKRFRSERRWLMDARGLSLDTIKTYEVGWDPVRDVYTIPVYDTEGFLVNVRRYDRNPKPDFPKMFSVKGHGKPTLYPLENLEYSGPIIICEGEWDALLTTQMGFPAITRTGAADVWHSVWNDFFRDRDVYVIHDMDAKGQRANTLVYSELASVASNVRIVDLPYPVEDKHGKDLSDYWLDGHTASDFHKLLSTDERAYDLTVLDSLDGARLGEVGRLSVRVAGVGSRSFLVPNLVSARCGQDYGEEECAACPMSALNGSTQFEIPPSDKSVLGVMYGGAKAERQALMRNAPVNFDCPNLAFNVETSHTVQKLFVTQAIDQQTVDETHGEQAQHYNTIRQVHAVGVHDAISNENLEMVGCMHVNPKDHGNEFVAWGVHKVETGLDRFELDDEMADMLSDQFYAPEGKVGKKLASIADDTAEHVTRIYGRRNMHIMMDLVFHSVLRFHVGREEIRKGWLDAIVVGETRTGKSEAALRLLQNYRAGEIISCESASLAGVLGGVQQLSGSEWVVTWGVIPFNDQRLVVLDEVSGLTPEEIGALSSLRSTGVAELTKIRAEKALARTRLIWIGNPRNPRAHYTTGMHMLEDLVPKPEDLARFDLAMSVHAGEPGTERANEYRKRPPQRAYDDELLRALVMWSWSRKAEDIVVTPDTVEAIYETAKDLGSTYTERPPLVQSANVRQKLARVAAAMAARTFCTEDGRHLQVRPDHVSTAAKFMRALYDNEKFGYGDESRYERERIARAVEHWEDGKRMLMENKALSMFLRGAHESFTMLELRNSAQYPDISLAIADAGSLYQWGFLDPVGNSFRVNKQMIDLLKEVPR